MSNVATRVAACALVIVVSGCADRLTGGSDPATDSRPPVWTEGDWWQYETSDHYTMTQTYEGPELVNNVQTYRVKFHLSAPDSSGIQDYTVWFAQQTFGWMGSRSGNLHQVSQCPSGNWFPLDQVVEDDCNTTLYNGGSLVREYDQHVTKTPVGWEDIKMKAGTFHAFRMAFADEANRTALTAWYAPEVENRAQWIREGTTYSLSAWGAKSEAEPA